MKEVLCRSLIGTLDAPNDASNPFSPTGASQSSSTWSPTIATSITNRFLSNVQQQKKQTFERLMQKEMTSSQLSFSRLTGDDGESNDGMPELVIGDETAIMEPPVSERDILPVESPPEVGGSSLFDAPLLGGNTSRSFIELDEEKEQAQSEALMRKHELWRLRQKHLREQLHAEKAVSQLKRTEPQSSHAQAPTTTTPTTAVVSSSAVSARVSTGDVNGSFDVLMVTQRSVMQRAHGATLGLSTDHIDMIRRVNNFDNTSSQRVVVFEAKSSKQGLASSSSSSKHQGKL
ncbi:hypothetical protein DQ04_07381000 [Trypanosoma grayi]|uniref:hypothetical protein n=1 Tax=Trypanosoma grayi TaxID=71804 RepID=UPI0004F495B0|nr:hypothetical protein DQ04_07381000 [Trypanosoma grayi]KEG08355.1 hypothetical protein DQ04_07381000 [Trypanosoma grayi]